MHYEVKHLLCDGEPVTCIPAFLNKTGIDENDVFDFIDFIEVEIGKGNTFEMDYFNDAREYLVDWKHDSAETFEQYRKFNYYLDKLKWLKIKNISIYYNNIKKELNDKIIQKYPDIKYSVYNLGVNASNHRKALIKIQKELALESFDEIDE